MNKLSMTMIVAGALAAGGCDHFLDVNTNPNAPEKVSANLYISPMEHWMVTAPQFDGRFIGRYAQEWALVNGQTTITTWDKMGYDPGSDNGAEQWRDVYWSLGQGLVDMINKAEAEKRLDVAGVGYVMKAWGWLVLTDMHGEIISINEAIDPTRSTFDYTTQDSVYTEVQRLLRIAIKDLNTAPDPTTNAVDQTYLAKTDLIYAGDRTKWAKLAHGLLAISFNHYTNKGALYKPDSVIANVDSSFAGNADDALLAYPCNDAGFADCNFNARTRNNITNYRQTQFVVGLMNGTQFGGAVDPRMTRILAVATDGQYRGVDPTVAGYGAMTAAQQPFNLFGYSGTGGLNLPSRYIFDNKSKFPFMTYSQLQFVKAEAAYIKGDKVTALAAYKTAIDAHIDFVNSRNNEISSQSATQITAAEKTAFDTDVRIVPPAAALTLTQIMSQKYIAEWGWGHNEVWMDLRRYHYTDIDPASGKQVFPGFTPPSTTLYPDNGGKVAYRIRPRYNSEYVWNSAALSKIGGLAPDYHTKPIWIVTP